jgi:ATP-binding cassette subfamily B protein/ATP-binding cassette subfamily C protein
LHPHHPTAPPPPAGTLKERLSGARVVFRQLPGTIRLVWEADRKGAIAVIGLTLVLALLPAGIAWVGKLIVDGVVLAARTGAPAARAAVVLRVAAEAALLAAQMGAVRLEAAGQPLALVHCYLPSPPPVI